MSKPRIRVKAGRGVATHVPMPAVRRPAATMRYLRDDRTGVLSMRQAVTRDAAFDVRVAAERASALALDFMQNCGWIAGVVDQVIVDTVGTELKLNLRPDLSRLGYDEKETSDWCRLVEAEWRRYAWNPSECDLAGKTNIPEALDGAMRHYLAYGEAFGVLDYYDQRQRGLYGVRTGTKVSLVAPHRLPRRTSELEGLQDGIFHDANGRATHYRFRRREDGFERDHDVPARDATGLARVLHVMDRGAHPGCYRGISPMAPIFKVIAQYDQLADATLATALMQTIFAATIKSPEPSEAAFEAIRTLADGEAPKGWSGGERAWQDHMGALAGDLMDVWGQRIEALKDGGVNLADSARIGHLGPGEDLVFHTAQTPGSQYQPFTANLKREAARCIGVTATAASMDFNGATYSSVRMETACIWPLAVRRRERIPAPLAQGIMEAWLDESIATGRIPFKGGYRAFANNRDKVCWSEWQGPAAPTADDYRAALAAGERLEKGLSSLSDECALYGRDWEETARQRARERGVVVDELGLPDPFAPMTGGAGPLGSAAPGRREPASSTATAKEGADA
ncbi:phage portal protein [Paracoccus sp. (in: a-proteobacteria)]|uniref:phage portal protein n=1 Tax=Paracoccus sp. TaxID=267 RepID=UPI002AFDDCB0|nr:phage portal protein [Paracoccus sp. (in: a-proteobacteria)]